MRFATSTRTTVDSDNQTTDGILNAKRSKHLSNTSYANNENYAMKLHNFLLISDIFDNERERRYTIKRLLNNTLFKYFCH